MVRFHKKRINNATEEFANKHGRDPSDKMLAHRIGISVGTLHTWKREAAMMSMTTSMDAVRRPVWFHRVPDHDITLLPSLKDSRQAKSDATLRNTEWWSKWLIGFLPSERAVCVLYWRYDWTMKRIGQHLRMSQSRVSQMHSEIVARLKELRNRDDFSESIKGGKPRLLRGIFRICHAERRRRNRSRIPPKIRRQYGKQPA